MFQAACCDHVQNFPSVVYVIFTGQNYILYPQLWIISFVFDDNFAQKIIEKQKADILIPVFSGMLTAKVHVNAIKNKLDPTFRSPSTRHQFFQSCLLIYYLGCRQLEHEKKLTMMVRLTVVVWFLLSLVGNGLAQEVLGCGGFVKSSKSNIDLSRIQIGLFEKRGSNLRWVQGSR